MGGWVPESGCLIPAPIATSGAAWGTYFTFLHLGFFCWLTDKTGIAGDCNEDQGAVSMKRVGHRAWWGLPMRKETLFPSL